MITTNMREYFSHQPEVCQHRQIVEAHLLCRGFSLIWRRHHCQWRAANFELSSALMAIEQCGFFSVLHLTVTRDIRLLSPRTRDTHTYCQEFGSWAVTTWFYDLGLSRLGLPQHLTFRLRGERSNPLRNRHSAYQLTTHLKILESFQCNCLSINWHRRRTNKRKFLQIPTSSSR